MKITLKMDSYEDRNKMVVALANQGYKVWIEEIKNFPYHSTHTLCFNLKDKQEYSGAKIGHHCKPLEEQGIKEAKDDIQSDVTVQWACDTRG